LQFFKAQRLEKLNSWIVSICADLLKFVISRVLNELLNKFFPDATPVVLLIDAQKRQLDRSLVFATPERAAAYNTRAFQGHKAIIVLARHEAVDLE
jgi:hypothetical protein